jgi:ABC-type transport system substrate-binding protein
VSGDSHFGPLIVREPSLEPFALAFNEGIKPFDNPLVRQAVSMAVNRTRLIKLIGKYRVTPLDQWFPTGLNAYDPTYKGVSYDPVQAKALLGKAGYAKGFSTTFLAGLWPDTAADTVVGQAIQQDLAQIGIQVTVRTVTQATALTLTAKPHAIPMWTTWWGPDFPEASDYLETLYRCGQFPPEGFNDIRYCNRRADALLQQAESTSSAAGRAALEQQVQRIILGDYAVLPLFQLNYVTIRPQRLANYYIHPNWQWDYAYYRLT